MKSFVNNLSNFKLKKKWSKAQKDKAKTFRVKSNTNLD